MPKTFEHEAFRQFLGRVTEIWAQDRDPLQEEWVPVKQGGKFMDSIKSSRATIVTL